MDSRVEIAGIVGLTVIGIASLVVGYNGMEQAFIVSSACVGGVAGLLRQSNSGTEDNQS